MCSTVSRHIPQRGQFRTASTNPCRDSLSLVGSTLFRSRHLNPFMMLSARIDGFPSFLELFFPKSPFCCHPFCKLPTVFLPTQPYVQGPSRPFFWLSVLRFARIAGCILSIATKMVSGPPVRGILRGGQQVSSTIPNGDAEPS